MTQLALKLDNVNIIIIIIIISLKLIYLSAHYVLWMRNAKMILIFINKDTD